ncbi:MAG TPA: sigma-70 family RNA polymerase sigma factor, partial [Gaiellaceae bacterium]|nr:sigma-70 family RNA polymerase sigma factor [Gaiellaceae bacterium]
SPDGSTAPGSRGRAAAGGVVGELFAEHGRMVLGLCRLLLRDAVEAEDAAQQVFLSAHSALLRGSVPRDPPAWLGTIARNECRGRIRARMREPLALPELPADLPDPLAAAIRATDLDAVWKALSRLPRRQRRALMLRELGGLSYHELGRALGVSQSAVESLLFRARRHVRSLIAGANAAAVPLALRHELGRLIPDFDPGSAGLAVRIASAPVALKLATAAVGIGVVTTGVSQVPHHAAIESRAQPAAGVAARDPVRRAAPKALVATHRSSLRPLVSRRHVAGRRAARHADTAVRDDGSVQEAVKPAPQAPESDQTGSSSASPQSTVPGTETVALEREGVDGNDGTSSAGSSGGSDGSGSAGSSGGSVPDDSGR